MQEETVHLSANCWEKIISFFTTTINWIVGIILSLIGLLSIFVSVYFINSHNNNSETSLYKWDSFFVNIIGILVLFCLVYIGYRLSKKIPLKVLLILVLVIFIILQGTWVNIIKYNPRADQAFVVDAAQNFKQGNYKLLEKGNYLDVYPFQLGIVYWLEGSLHIVGDNNLLGLQYMNVIASAICIFCLYIMCKKFFKNENINRVMLLLCLTFVPLILMSTFVYGTLVGLAFALTSLVLLLHYFETDKMKFGILSALSIGLAMILKSNFSIFLIAMIMILVIFTIHKKSMKSLGSLFCFFIIVYFSSQLVGIYTKWRTGYDINGRGVPIISYFNMGMQEGYMAPGWYNESTIQCYSRNQFDVSKTKEESKSLLKVRAKELIKDPKYTAKFFAKKLGSTWLNPTFQSIWINIADQPLEGNPTYQEYLENNHFLISLFDGKLNKIITYFLDFYQVLIFVGAGIYLIINRKKLGYQSFVIALIVLGGFTYHLISETKSLYMIPYYFIILIYAAAQLQQTFEWLDNKFIGKSKIKKLSENQIKEV